METYRVTNRGKATFFTVALLMTFTVAVVLVLTPPDVVAAEWKVVEDDDWCREAGKGYCEVREITLPADRGDVAVKSTNGSVSVTGWDRDEIHVRALIKVSDWGGSAKEMAAEIEISTGSTIKASGPGGRWWDFFRGRKWSVSYRVMVPDKFDVDAHTTNGGVSVTDVTGEIDAGTTNGRVRLIRVDGDVEGGTTNGGIVAVLEGNTWKGSVLDLHTTNGGVSVTMPEGYSAELDVSTVNGGISVDFPIRIEKKRRSRLTGTIGDGGPVIHVRTINGGVKFIQGD